MGQRPNYGFRHDDPVSYGALKNNCAAQIFVSPTCEAVRATSIPVFRLEAVAKNPVQPSPPSATLQQQQQQQQQQQKTWPSIVSTIRQYATGDFKALSKQRVSITPTGFLNNNNVCYINAVLQCLLSIPVFVNFLKDLHKAIKLPPLGIDAKEHAPLIESLTALCNKLLGKSPIQIPESRGTYSGSLIPAPQILIGQTFSPDDVYNVFADRYHQIVIGKQEDAEEFMGILLEGLHTECQLLLQTFSEQPQKHMHKAQTPIEAIFYGKIKSVLTTEHRSNSGAVSPLPPQGDSSPSFSATPGPKTASGTKTASETLQHFQSLQLDINHDEIHTVKGALAFFNQSEEIHGFTCEGSGTAVPAYRRYFFESLPKILILHLKRFIYSPGQGIVKIDKRISYDKTLVFDHTYMSSPAGGRQTYKLMGIVYHHGASATDGHYSSEARLLDDTWIHYNDNYVENIDGGDFADELKNRMAYLLIYQLST